MKVLNSKNRILAFLAVLLIGFFSIAAFFWQDPGSDESYRKFPVIRQDLQITIQSVGSVEPENRLEIKPPVPGRIEKGFYQEGHKVQKGELLAIMSSAERAALLDGALLQGSQEFKKWKQYYKPTPILAPISGTVISRNVETGQSVNVDETIFVISDRLIIKSQVDETDLASIRLKQKATVTLDADPGSAISASVTFIGYEANFENNVTTYEVRLATQDVPHFMRSGMTANISFLVEAKKNILTIPNEALQFREGRTFVSVSENSETDRPVEKPVLIGATDGLRTEVLQGLSEQDVVWVPENKGSE